MLKSIKQASQASDDGSEIIDSAGGTMYSGARAVALVRAATIKVAIESYARTGMQVNRAYTPKAMLRAASEITGRKYKSRQFDIAATDLDEYCTALGATIPVRKE